MTPGLPQMGGTFMVPLILAATHDQTDRVQLWAFLGMQKIELAERELVFLTTGVAGVNVN